MDIETIELLTEDLQCDAICSPDKFYVPGQGVVCTGCGTPVILLAEKDIL